MNWVEGPRGHGRVEMQGQNRKCGICALPGYVTSTVVLLYYSTAVGTSQLRLERTQQVCLYYSIVHVLDEIDSSSAVYHRYHR